MTTLKQFWQIIEQTTVQMHSLVPRSHGNEVELCLRRRHASWKIFGFYLQSSFSRLDCLNVFRRTSSENITDSQKGPGHEPRFAGDLPVKRCKLPDAASQRGLTQWRNQLLYPAASLDVTVA